LSVSACVTGATGFLGGHIARLLCERGDHVRLTCRDPGGLGALEGLDARWARAEVCDYRALRSAFEGADVVFHTAGFVGSRPADRAWRVNAEGPLVAVEAAAAAGCRRVVLTSSISAIGLPSGEAPADERTRYPEEWLRLTYPDSKHEGERVALEAAARHGVELVVVNPGYALGAPLDRARPRAISSRIVGNYLRGRLPAVISAPMNFVDVEDAAAGHLLAADRGKPGERYILGGSNTTWPALIDRVAQLSGVRRPVVVLPRETARVARLGDTLGVPELISVEGYELMAQDWRFSSAKAEHELGYRTRPLDRTIRATIDWYEQLIEEGAFDESHRSSLSMLAAGTRTLSRLGLLEPLKLGQRLAGRRVIAGV
jgi:dihydroflavonol-4-reductase